MSILNAVAARMPRRPDITAAQPSGITALAGHLVHTGNTVTAWHVIPEIGWQFRTDSARQADLDVIAEQYAAVAVAIPGVRVHLRRTTVPLGAHPDGGLWPLDGHVGVTYLGVTVPTATTADGLLERGKAALGMAAASSADERTYALVDKASAHLAAGGLNARPASAAEMGWLLYRSVGLGLPIGDIRLLPLDSPDAVQAVYDAVDVFREHRYGTVLRMRDAHSGEQRFTTILTLGHTETIAVPERHLPWAHVADQLPFPVEVSHRATLGWPGKRLGMKLLQIRNQERDWRSHDFDVPPTLQRQAERALAIADQVDNGRPVDAVRATGFVRFAVSGETVAEVTDRAAELIDRYRTELRWAVAIPKDQPLLLREFAPGEPDAPTGYLRHMPVRLLAAGVPQASTLVGDDGGDWIGTVGAHRRPVTVDVHAASEQSDRSGLSVVVAEPGGGKSTLIGSLTYLAARRGVYCTVIDPSGPLARLTAMPDLAGRAQSIDLTAGGPGILNPYRLVPIPAGDADGANLATAERRQLVADICLMLLPPQVAVRDDVVLEVTRAVRKVPATAGSTLDDVVDALHTAGGVGELAAECLEDRSELAAGRMFFGEPPVDHIDDPGLLVITMPGLVAPDPRKPRQDWTVTETLAAPVLLAATWLTVRRCYSQHPSVRKLAAIDEGHILAGWTSGQAVFNRLARDSRKWNIAALLSSQNPRDILGLDLQNLTGTAWVGRVASDRQVASDALRLLGDELVDAGYEAAVAGLSSNPQAPFREFLHRDIRGRVGKVRVDLTHIPGLLDVLNTTPGGTR